MGRITIKDIAKILKVNPSTVSRGLKGHPDISKGMQQKIKQVASDLGYRPNFQAIHFRRKKSGLIGLVLPAMNMFFFPSVIKAVEEEARLHGYNLVVFQSGESLQKEIENVEICKGFGVEGILISVSKETTDLLHFDDLKQEQFPVVFFDKVIENEHFPTVTIADEAAAYKAVSHLLEKGYKNICGLFDNPSLAISQKRFAGMKRAMQDFNLPIQQENCLFTRNAKEAKEVFKVHLSNSKSIDCFFVMSDELLAIGIEIIYEQGLKIPDDIAVVSISDGQLPYFLNPKITHIHHSGFEVGQKAIRKLLSMIKARTEDRNKNIHVDTFLVKLAST